jgi:hypothetical protein
VKINDRLDGLSSRTSRRKRYAQDCGVTAMERSLPVIVVRQGMKRLGKLHMPFGALAVRQAFKYRVLQQSEPFRIAVVLGDLEVFFVHVGNFVRRRIRENVMQMAADRAAFEIVVIAFAISPAHQHIGFEMSN